MYWYKQWHLDTDLHKKMFINNVEQIKEGTVVSVYGDSVDKDTIIKTDIGTHRIEDLYNTQNNLSERTDKEVIEAKFKALNWTEDRGLHYSKVKNIIRHKTTKDKWKIRVGGKEIIVTNDHSMIVFRDNEKIEIKPSEIKPSDKIMVISHEDK